MWCKCNSLSASHAPCRVKETWQLLWLAALQLYTSRDDETIHRPYRPVGRVVEEGHWNARRDEVSAKCCKPYRNACVLAACLGGFASKQQHPQDAPDFDVSFYCFEKALRNLRWRQIFAKSGAAVKATTLRQAHAQWGTTMPYAWWWCYEEMGQCRWSRFVS